MKNRHVVGAGAAVCAACCIAPLLTLPVVAGLGAAVAAFICSGAFLALVVAARAGLLLWQPRPRQRRHDSSCSPADAPIAGPIDIEVTTLDAHYTASGTDQPE